MEDKVRAVHIDENSDGVPKILFTTSKDTYIVTFGEALEWWRQSDEAYHRHPLQLSLDLCATFEGTHRPRFKWASINGSPSEYGLYVLIGENTFLLGGKFVSQL